MDMEELSGLGLRWVADRLLGFTGHVFQAETSDGAQ